MTLNTFTSTAVSGVRLTRDSIDEFRRIVDQANVGGTTTAPSGYQGRRVFSVEVKRAHNSMEFDSIDELDAVVTDFPEWRTPDSIKITSEFSDVSTYNRSSLVYRRTVLSMERGGKCNVYVSGDTNRWALTTGSLVESFLRKHRGIQRWYRSLVVIMLLAFLAVTLPVVVGSWWFASIAIPTLIFTVLLMAGMPLGNLLDANSISLRK